MAVIEERADPNKHPPRPACWRSPPRYVVGADLGQAADPTAICVLHCYGEREDPTEPILQRYHVRHLQRMPLGMSYPAIVQDIGMLLQRPPLSGTAELVVDESGVGRAVTDIFRQAGLKPIGVTITGGDSPGEMAGGYRYRVSQFH